MNSIGTFGSYTQARLAIYASQAGLSVTGNNIANINTFGYTRQRLEQSSFYAGGADRYYSSFGARTGNGVLCTGVSQLRDPYLDIRYRSQMSNVGAMDAKLGGLEGIQAILDEVSDGEDGFGIISAQLDKMYDALQQLTDQTGHDVYDTQVRAAADALAKQINSYANRLSELYNNTLAGYKQDVETVNNILSNIRELNASIRKSEIHGDNALELRDERNLLIDQLSEYMKIDVVYTEEDIGAGQTVEKLTIRLGNANPDADVTTDSTLLVDGTYAAQFSITQVPQPNPNFDPTKPPNGVDNFQYLKPDGSGTNNANLAQLIDSPNFDLTVSELRDINGRIQYTMEKGPLETITKAEYDVTGVCAKCYGMNLATQNPVGPGEAVGIIAAQSIGEPGTQLTMRTFHTGGLAGGDITQGLPRVEELFEARRPKRMATLAEIGGKVKFEEASKGSLLNIIITADDGDTRTYAVPHTGLQVKDGDVIEAGTQLTYGALNPHDVLRIRGADAVYNYLIQEVLRVYRQQGVDINDKHIEVIVRQMMRKVRLEDAGDTKLLDGSMVDVLELDDANEEIERRNAAGETNEAGDPLRKAVGTQLLMGITKASLATDSFLSAASFQETTTVLTEAAIKGKADHLLGLKENVIIGKLIPAGTGLQAYNSFADAPAEIPAMEEAEPVLEG